MVSTNLDLAKKINVNYENLEVYLLNFFKKE
jgi:hypothetical protein